MQWYSSTSNQFLPLLLLSIIHHALPVTSLRFIFPYKYTTFPMVPFAARYKLTWTLSPSDSPSLSATLYILNIASPDTKRALFDVKLGKLNIRGTITTSDDIIPGETYRFALYDVRPSWGMDEIAVSEEFRFVSSESEDIDLSVKTAWPSSELVTTTSSTVSSIVEISTTTSSTSPVGPTTAATSTTLQSQRKPKSRSTASKAGIGIGASVGSLLLLGLIFFFYRRSKNSNRETKTKKTTGGSSHHDVAYTGGKAELEGTSKIAEVHELGPEGVWEMDGEGKRREVVDLGGERERGVVELDGRGR